VTAVSPTVTGPAVAIRGNATRAVVLYGVDPERFARIYPIRQRMVAGRFEPTGTGCVIGRELALDLGVGVGDTAAPGRPSRGRARCTPSRGLRPGQPGGQPPLGGVTMRGAQTLLDLVGGVSSVDLRVRDIFGRRAWRQTSPRARGSSRTAG
jgi:lipoprotein-releasing system permease protein